MLFSVAKVERWGIEQSQEEPERFSAIQGRDLSAQGLAVAQSRTPCDGEYLRNLLPILTTFQDRIGSPCLGRSPPFRRNHDDL